MGLLDYYLMGVMVGGVNGIVTGAILTFYILKRRK